MLLDATISRRRSKAQQRKGFNKSSTSINWQTPGVEEKHVQTNLSDYNFSKNSAHASTKWREKAKTGSRWVEYLYVNNESKQNRFQPEAN